MTGRRRREFLTEVGRGMLIAGAGYATAVDLGLARAVGDADLAQDVPHELSFGDREPLVRLLQDTPADRLQPLLIERWKTGTPLHELVAAAALANARTFGGEDYIGFHTMMALTPAWRMSQELPTEQSPLPILKVLYRNSHRIQEHGGHASEILHPLSSAADAASSAGAGAGSHAAQIREAVLRKDGAAAERLLAESVQQSPADGFNDLLAIVQENAEVHRVVLPYRAWDLLELVGTQHALTMLRQSVRYCVKSERSGYPDYARGGSQLLPRLFDQFRLADHVPGSRLADDQWVEQLSQTIFRSTPEQAAEAVAAALAEGFGVSAIGEALTLATNQLLLRDPGRPQEQSQPNKPPGSVHGDSIGVHACDSANAWRNMAAISNPRNSMACLILGAWQAAFDRTARGGEFLTWKAWPLEEHLAAVTEDASARTVEQRLQLLDAAIRRNDQATASAVVAALESAGQPARAVLDVLLRYAISEDGALHAEKFYRTVSQEFADTRPAFRWRHLIALARVTASEFGAPAPGMAQARELLRV